MKSYAPLMRSVGLWMRDILLMMFHFSSRAVGALLLQERTQSSQIDEWDSLKARGYSHRIQNDTINLRLPERNRNFLRERSNPTSNLSPKHPHPSRCPILHRPDRSRLLAPLYNLPHLLRQLRPPKLNTLIPQLLTRHSLQSASTSFRNPTDLGHRRTYKLSRRTSTRSP